MLTDSVIALDAIEAAWWRLREAERRIEVSGAARFDWWRPPDGYVVVYGVGPSHDGIWFRWRTITPGQPTPTGPGAVQLGPTGRYERSADGQRWAEIYEPARPDGGPGLAWGRMRLTLPLMARATCSLCRQQPGDDCPHFTAR